MKLNKLLFIIVAMLIISSKFNEEQKEDNNQKNRTEDGNFTDTRSDPVNNTNSNANKTSNSTSKNGEANIQVREINLTEEVGKQAEDNSKGKEAKKRKQKKQKKKKDKDDTEAEEEDGEEDEEEEEDDPEIDMIYNEEMEKNKKQTRKERKKMKQEEIDWNERINSFIPTQIITFAIPKGESQVLYEMFEESNTPAEVSAVFYVHDLAKIDLFITDKKKTKIHKFEGRDKLFYQFVVPFQGEYKFKLINAKYTKDTTVTFAIKITPTTKKTEMKQEISKMDQQVNSIDEAMKEIVFYQRMSQTKISNHFDKTKKYNKNIVFSSIVETTIMIAILFGQLIYIKKLVK